MHPGGRGEPPVSMPYWASELEALFRASGLRFPFDPVLTFVAIGSTLLFQPLAAAKLREPFSVTRREIVSRYSQGQR